MTPEIPKPESAAFTPPVSAFTGPIAELVNHRLLNPPTRPGLAASLGNYEVLRVLGAGGMGVVVLARAANSGQEVAIKLIKPELVSDGQVVHRFVKEAGHLQKLKHPHIIPVLEISEREAGPYFVMPYFAGGSLSSRIKGGRPLDKDAVWEISHAVADGLVFAHLHGIIHRDLKPANILLDSKNGTCLADFGLARTLFNDTIMDVEREQFEGTAPYMSPGVAAGNAEDTRCDIYAFGALLYEMLTGQPPYTGVTTSDIRRQILSGPPRPIGSINADAKMGLVAIADGAMARELRDRYADMADVVRDLDRVKMGQKPVGPHGLSRPPKRFTELLGVPAGILLIVFGLWFLWSGKSEKDNSAAPATNQVAPLAQKLDAPSVILPAAPLPGPMPKPSPLPPATLAWRVYLLAGTPGQGGYADGPSQTARFNSPGGIAADYVGNVYVADTGNHVIRKISHGSVETLAGAPGQAGDLDGAGAAAQFFAPMGIAVDGALNIYVTEFASDVVRKITPAGVVTTLAGVAGQPGNIDGEGIQARLRNPWAVTVDSAGQVWIADRSNDSVRKISRTGFVSTVLGLTNLKDPMAITADLFGNIYVADSHNSFLTEFDARLGTVKELHSSTVTSPQSLASAYNETYVLDSDHVRDFAGSGPVRLPESMLTNISRGVIHPTALAIWNKNFYLLDQTNHAVWIANSRFSK